MNVREIYEGSDGAATRALYEKLQTRGVIGVVALNLFPAQKCSERAKVYRGGIRGKGSYRGMAYDRKQYSIEQLCNALKEHGQFLNIRWGWKEDLGSYVPWVLYVDTPKGQCSFHSPARGQGPDYPADWDGIRGISPHRIIQFVEEVLDGRIEVNQEPVVYLPVEPAKPERSEVQDVGTGNSEQLSLGI